jgi:hypothetical protein
MGDGTVEQTRRYLVVYRLGEEARVLGRLDALGPTMWDLDPYLSRLRREGVAHGEVLLVDAGTGLAVARRALDPPPRRRRA